MYYSYQERQQRELRHSNNLRINQEAVKRLAAKKANLTNNNIYSYFADMMVIDGVTDNASVFEHTVKEQGINYKLRLSLFWYGGELMVMETVSVGDDIVYAAPERTPLKAFLDQLTINPSPTLSAIYRHFLEAAKPFQVKPRKPKKGVTT